jgi:hypothetical protein
MGMAAFNRHRRQKMALADAKARDDAEQNKDLLDQDPKAVEEDLETYRRGEMGSPPYADEGQLINIRADADPEREKRAMEQAELNKSRVLTEEERWIIQNAHFRDDKTKAIPDHDEAGKDRTLKGQEASRRKASAPYEDPRVQPELDGRLRTLEPEEERPDADTTVSEVTAQDPTPPVVDDEPETAGKIADGEKVVTQDIPEESLSPEPSEPKSSNPPKPAPAAEPRKPGRPPKAQS